MKNKTITISGLVLAFAVVLCLVSCGGSSSPDRCEGVTCSDHGVCQSEGSRTWCDCGDGYHANGLTCLENTPDGDADGDVDGDGDLDGDGDADIDEDTDDTICKEGDSCEGTFFCRDGESCDGDGLCDSESGTPHCDDGINCTEDLCSEEDEECYFIPNNELCVGNPAHPLCVPDDAEAASPAGTSPR